MANTFGSFFRVTTWGESHGPAMGAVIDGCPSRVPLSIDDLRADLARDVPDPGIATARHEPNEPQILSGVFEGLTLGTPLSLLIPNVEACSDKYRALQETPRPGHADMTYRMRYGHVDWRGGSRASGRECIARIAAGAVARKILTLCGIEVTSRILELAGLPIESEEDYRKACRAIQEVGRQGDSTGGMVRVVARKVPAGMGSPVFDKLDAALAGALMGIGGVKSVEVGAGRAHASLKGHESNDAFIFQDGQVRTATNRCGGIQGGISNGMDLEITLAVKPTPSIGHPQKTVNLVTRQPETISNDGRYDLNFAPRVAVVGEAMMALVLVDHLIGSGFVHPVRFPESVLLAPRPRVEEATSHETLTPPTVSH